VRRDKHSGSGRRLVARGKAFEMHGVVPANRVWSRGGLRADGAVVLVLRAHEVHKTAGPDSYRVWAPNVGNASPWSDTPGGKERLEHCRLAVERGAAEALLTYGKGALPDLVDCEQLLSLSIGQRGEEYWATCVRHRRVGVVSHQ
jgi:hypothetical protein